MAVVVDVLVALVYRITVGNGGTASKLAQRRG